MPITQYKYIDDCFIVFTSKDGCDKKCNTGSGSEHSGLFILSLVKKTSRVSPTREAKTSDRLFFSKLGVNRIVHQNKTEIRKSNRLASILFVTLIDLDSCLKGALFFITVNVGCNTTSSISYSAPVKVRGNKLIVGYQQIRRFRCSDIIP